MASHGDSGRGGARGDRSTASFGSSGALLSARRRRGAAAAGGCGGDDDGRRRGAVGGMGISPTTTLSIGALSPAVIGMYVQRSGFSNPLAGEAALVLALAKPRPYPTPLGVEFFFFSFSDVRS